MIPALLSVVDINALKPLVITNLLIIAQRQTPAEFADTIQPAIIPIMTKQDDEKVYFD